MPSAARFLPIRQEQELHDVLIRLNKELIPDIVTYNYAGALKLAEQVVDPVNKFFDSVMVMDENIDVKNNRLALLEQAKEDYKCRWRFELYSSLIAYFTAVILSGPWLQTPEYIQYTACLSSRAFLVFAVS